jgi:antitoxin StbD
MLHKILMETTASVSELKDKSMSTVAAGDGLPVAILNRLEDIELNKIADARAG